MNILPKMLSDDDMDDSGNIIKPDSPMSIADIKHSEDLLHSLRPLNEFPDYIPEEDNPNVLVRGRWLERGGSAWIVSTAGTGKSIHSIQLACNFTMGRPFSGLYPLRPIRFWVIQSEDSDNRITIDREDIKAELIETAPDVDWDYAIGKIIFVNMTEYVGSRFISRLNELLTIAKKYPDMMPDALIINPFMAFVGGPITDGSYVTPFLRGGMLNGEYTMGLQALEERHNIAALLYHHTPKPPSEKELDAWMKSAFPEYQGAGSADITNWGRSFITMMKVKGHPRTVCLTAGKNGGELGWAEIGGGRRHYLSWSNGVGISGHGRHAWRELTEDELAEVTGSDEGEKAINEKVKDIVNALKTKAMYDDEIFQVFSQSRIVRTAWARIKENLNTYHLSRRKELVGRTWRTYYGYMDSIRDESKKARQQEKIDDEKEF